MMRPLFYDYPDDENLKDYSDAYLFGSDIIVSPVAEEGNVRSIFQKGQNGFRFLI